MTGHQYGRISALVSHISFCVKTVLVELRNVDCFPLLNERRLYARTNSFTRDHSLLVSLIMKNDFKSSNYIVIFLDFHSTKQGLPLVDSWSRGLD